LVGLNYREANRIILDREGKIVEIFAGETDAFYTRLDELLQ
jgi:hypothetical protein